MFGIDSLAASTKVLVLAILVVLVASATGSHVPATHAAGPFSDGTFANADWDITIFKTVTASSASRTQVNSGGDPGDYQQITHVMAGVGAVHSVHINPSATHDPGTDGAIASIDYSERARTDSTEFNTFGAVPGVALRQDSKIYARFLACTQTDCSGLPGTILPAPPATPWTTISAAGLTQGLFCRVIVGDRIAVKNRTLRPAAPRSSSDMHAHLPTPAPAPPQEALA